MFLIIILYIYLVPQRFYILAVFILLLPNCNDYLGFGELVKRKKIVISGEFATKLSAE